MYLDSLYPTDVCPDPFPPTFSPVSLQLHQGLGHPGLIEH